MGDPGSLPLAALALLALKPPGASEDFDRFAQTLASSGKGTQHQLAASVTKYFLSEGNQFPTQRRPVKRELSNEKPEIIEA